MSELTALEDWVAPLLARLSDGERRKLALAVARDLRAANAASILAQQTPDGGAWEARKQPARNKRGEIRRKAQAGKAGMRMFLKMGTPKNLKAMATPSEAVVGFVGRAERIARVHQFGLSDRVTPGGPTYRYPARELIGMTDAQIERVRDLIATHLGR
ncbi:phage virion morphogenesis protein [Curvibacter gracilis]|uniref:phage virion morphogenesis protein n=1 Tax=Curvibacter gracilis TaxID=230310 RepID=UPI00047FD3CD|nr:phage virion morphogenesis protein [Curvibacter gracilis]